MIRVMLLYAACGLVAAFFGIVFWYLLEVAVIRHLVAIALAGLATVVLIVVLENAAAERG